MGVLVADESGVDSAAFLCSIMDESKSCFALQIILWVKTCTCVERLHGKWDGVESLSRECLRVAVVGLGKMGILHASILSALPSVQLAALCDKSQMILKFSKRVFNRVHVVDDVEKLSGLDLDAVYITTPISSHFLIARAKRKCVIGMKILGDGTEQILLAR